ncbi:unnamed protein product [Protopolystoma xenopodis]|uniref:Uncharacterized protein n=1 Tax=Protopolystoma xenopodis TaxID=117903 RepID=A0A448WHR2_9PLAT|nr:unnamed protein product [Protopolystoma xenopodis]
MSWKQYLLSWRQVVEWTHTQKCSPALLPRRQRSDYSLASRLEHVSRPIRSPRHDFYNDSSRTGMPRTTNLQINGRAIVTREKFPPFREKLVISCSLDVRMGK